MVNVIGRMLLGSAIFRSLRSAPKWILALVAVAGLALMSFGARAQQDVQMCHSTAGGLSSDYWCNTRQEAYAAARAHAERIFPGKTCPARFVPPNRVYVAGYTFSFQNCENADGEVSRRWLTECQPGATWNNDTQQCDAPNPCTDKPPMSGKSAPGDAGGFCSGGCTYVADMENAVVLGHGTPNRRTFGTFTATGGQCTASNEPDTYDPNRGICQTVGATSSGAVSQCVQPDGRICVSVGGTRLCHQPGQTGDRINADGTLATNTTPEGETPTPPAQQVNPQHVTTTMTTVNNNTTVTGVYAGSGTRPGQSNAGPGGNDGSGTGTGSGSGNGDGDGEGDGPGSPGGQPGRFYQSNGKGIAEAYSAFAAQAQQAPLLGAVSNVLGGCTGGGACPAESWDGGDYAGTHSLAEWCSGPLALLLQAAGYVLLAGMGAVAIRIGLL